MAILQALPDPRLQVFTDFVSMMQRARRREEEERAAEREAQQQRYWTIPATVIGAVLGGVGGAAVGGATLGAVGGGGMGAMGLGGSAVAAGAGGATAGGILGGALTGAGLGAGVGQAFAGGDYAGGIQQAAQGAATLANLPELQQQGYSPLEVGMGGAQGLPNILADVRARRRQGEYLSLRGAQIDRRQQENLVRQEVVARRQRDEAFKALPPDAQATIATRQNLIAQARINLRRGEYGPSDSPGALEAFNQAIAPHLIEIEETYRDKQPPPPPTIDETIEQGVEVSLRPELGGGFTRNAKGELKWFKTSPSFTALERQELLETKSKEFEVQFEEEEIARSQQNILQGGAAKSAEKAEAMARKLFDSVQANARIVKERAQQAAEQYVERFMPASRLPHLRPTAEEKTQQQEAAKQQQEAAEQQQQAQQQQAQEQQQQQQLQQAQVMFQTSGQTLASIGQEWGTAPSEWSKSKVEAARPPAEAFLQTLPVLLPMMTPEQSQEIKPLIVLATAIASQPRTLTIPELLPNENR